eukprot:scaffold69682_cov21-Prasinocladus_malaysianus.AAC.1
MHHYRMVYQAMMKKYILAGGFRPQGKSAKGAMTVVREALALQVKHQGFGLKRASEGQTKRPSNCKILGLNCTGSSYRQTLRMIKGVQCV